MPFQADMDKLLSIWPGGPKARDAEDLFRVSLDLGGRGEIIADTHLFAESDFTILPYADFDSLSRDASGFRHASGDAALAQSILPGQIAFSIKHHRCAHRYLDSSTASEDVKEHLKLQDTHIQFVAGVCDRGRGKPGVVTLNSPQSYGSPEGTPGRFGTADYPMIFVVPVFPDYLPVEHHQSFVDNIRTMAVAFNAVAKFPGNGRYNGGDPLAASSPQRVLELVKQMVTAIAARGQQQRAAMEWFAAPENLIYCAEYAFIAASAGCLCPLNTSCLEPLVGQEICENFLSVLDRSASGHETVLTRSNPNKMVKFVTTTIAPESLSAMPVYAPNSLKQSELNKLAFLPFTPADIVDHAMRLHFDRKKYGESMAEVQAIFMKKMLPGFIEMLNLDQPDADPHQRNTAISVYQQLIEIVATEHSSYQQFRRELDPVLNLAKNLPGGRGSNDSGDLFVPPSLFHIVARNEHSGGLLGLSYLGHGLHLSLVH